MARPKSRWGRLPNDGAYVCECGDRYLTLHGFETHRDRAHDDQLISRYTATEASA